MARGEIHIVPTKAKVKQMDNQTELLEEKGYLVMLTFSKICRYILSEKVMIEVSHRKKGNKEAVDYNFLDFNKEWILDLRFTEIERLSSNREKNRRCNKIIKELIDAGAIHHITQHKIMINPLFYYKGNRYLDCYQDWINLTGDKPVHEYVKNSVKTQNIVGKWEFIN